MAQNLGGEDQGHVGVLQVGRACVSVSRQRSSETHCLDFDSCRISNGRAFVSL